MAVVRAMLEEHHDREPSQLGPVPMCPAYNVVETSEIPSTLNGVPTHPETDDRRHSFKRFVGTALVRDKCQLELEAILRLEVPRNRHDG